MDKNFVIIIRHRKENVKKCSLRGLESQPNMAFYSYPKTVLPDLSNAVLLDMEGRDLSSSDKGPFVVLDATWRYAAVMQKQLPQLSVCKRRQIPRAWKTAYPRRQGDCPNPELGLASIEAIFAALWITGSPVEGLLDGYYWKDSFLAMNASLLCR